MYYALTKLQLLKSPFVFVIVSSTNSNINRRIESDFYNSRYIISSYSNNNKQDIIISDKMVTVNNKC